MPQVFEGTNRILKDVIADKHGDPHRIYLAGQSMGGNGAWLYASAHTKIFAGVMVVCGYTRHRKETETVAQALTTAGTPVLVVHSEVL